jgi:(4S)-4-hydroxy-5-phosphonooxypentane-2,3-dione isomerase
MLIVQVYIKVKIDCIAHFKTITLENAKCSVIEKGVFRFDVMQNMEDPHCFQLQEVYYTLEDQLKHRETEHFKKWKDEVESLLVEPYTFKKYTETFLS